MSRSFAAVAVAIITLVVAHAGCASEVGQVAPPGPPTREGPVNPTLSSVTDAVLDDAARRTGFERVGLVVESAMAVTWADGSLGCPQPGMNYTMALVPGYRIRIRAGEQLLDYHASRSGYYVLCPAGQAIDPLDGAAFR